MCTKHRFAVISHLGFKLRWMLICVLQQQGCFHPGAPTGLWVPKCPQKWEPSGACSCRPITSLYVTLLFFLSSHWAFKTCRSPRWVRAVAPWACAKRHPYNQATQVPPLISFWCSHLHFPGEMVPGYFCEVLSSCWTSLKKCLEDCKWL